jgi:hypothetical protein
MASAADLALAYQSQRKFAESEALAREALELERKEQPDDWQQFRTENLLGAQPRWREEIRRRGAATRSRRLETDAKLDEPLW